MIKKSYRKAFDENLLPKYEEEKAERKLKTVLNLLNRCISNCISIPEGYYLCPRCKAKDVINIFPRKLYSGKGLFLSFCDKCDGVGYIDFASNAMVHHPKTKLLYNIPLSWLTHPKLEIASIIFYAFNFNNHFSEISPNFKNNRCKKTVNEFIDYFISYKKEREKRKKFLEKNFDGLRERILEETKVTDVPSKKIACKICNLNPIDIAHYPYNDYIKIKICGNCYGQGYQSKRDTKMTTNCLVDVINPDYNNKQKMLRSILLSADLNIKGFMFHITRMAYNDKKKSK